MNDRKKSNRREFLKGRAAAQAARRLAADSLPPPDTHAAARRSASAEKDTDKKTDTSPRNRNSTARTGDSPTEKDRIASHLVEFSNNAMGCQFQFLLNLQEYPQAADAVLECFRIIEDIEQQMSTYRPDSDINRINHAPPDQPVRCPQALFECLSLAQEIAKQTGGAFDHTSGPLTRVWGFERRQPAIPSDSDLQTALARVGYQFVELAPDNRSVTLGLPEMQLNLGAIGKGYALDRCAEHLDSNGVNDYLIHGGQSSVLARGKQTRTRQQAAPPPSGSQDRPVPRRRGNAGTHAPGGWTIGITHPSRPKHRLTTINLLDQALGTSGSSRQAFYHRGKKLSHTIDPRTGRPSSEILSATVISESAARCDALATALCVLPISEARQLACRLGLQALLFYE